MTAWCWSCFHSPTMRGWTVISHAWTWPFRHRSTGGWSPRVCRYSVPRSTTNGPLMASVNFCYGVIVMIRFLLTVVFGLLALAAQLLVLVLLMPGFSGEQIPLSTVCVWQLLAAVCAGVFFACMPADKSAAWRRGLFTQT